jgi:hypothetical protein
MALEALDDLCKRYKVSKKAVMNEEKTVTYDFRSGKNGFNRRTKNNVAKNMECVKR